MNSKDIGLSILFIDEIVFIKYNDDEPYSVFN
jgi:hypothetical protein